MKLSALPNIGKELERMLNNVGILTAEQLKKTGSVEAVAKLAMKGEACLSKLYAVEGAVRGVRWHLLAEKDREELKKKYYDRLKK